MNSSVIFLLSICSINALRLRVDNAKFVVDFDVDIEGPLKPDDVKKLKANPLMAELKNRIDKWNGQTIYFIGDSTIRNQFMAFCLLLNEKEIVRTTPTIAEMSEYRGHPATESDIKNNHGWAGCKDSKKTAFFAMTSEPNVTAFDMVMKRAPKPDVVYWNAGTYCMYGKDSSDHYHEFWEAQCAEENYKKNLVNAIQTMKSEAPNAKFPFMLSHSICFSDMYKENVRQINQHATNVMTAENVFQDVPVIDAFTMTDGKCRLADKAGVHYNTMVFDEIKSMMDATGFD